MPGFEYPQSVVETPPIKVAVSDKEYKHSIVDTKETPLNSLVTHIEGSSRIVDYYSQVLSAGEEPQTYSTDLAPHLQQYRLIKDFEIKQQDFDYDFDDELNQANGQGTAIIYPPLMPNMGDVFIADIGNGKAGLLNITGTPKKKSIFKQACYEVDFTLLFIIETQAQVDLINAKVVETYNFVKDFILYGQNPLLVNSEFNLLNDSKRILTEAIEDFISEFYSRELTTLVPPGYTRPTYDPFAVKAFMEVVEVSTNVRASKIKMKNTDELKEFWEDSIWAALISPSLNQHTTFWTKARAVNVRTYNMHPRINSIRFSGFDMVLRPLDKLKNVDTYYKLNEGSQAGYYGWYVGSVNPITATGTVAGGGTSLGRACWCKVQNYYHAHHHKLHPWDPTNHLAHIEQYQHTCHDPDCPCVCHTPLPGQDEETTNQNSYIFTPEFWTTGVIAANGFEQVVKKHLSMDKVDAGIINKLLLERNSWTPKQRFYRMLVLIIILIGAIRSM